MRVRPRTRRPVTQLSMVGLSRSLPSPRGRRRWPWAAGALAAVVAAAAAFAFFAWPRGALALDSAALARLDRPAFGGGTMRVSVWAHGARIPVTLRSDGRLWPARPVAPGTRLLVEVVFRRPGWVGWIAGHTQRLRLEVTAPRARLERRWLRLKRGAPLRVSFDRPVRKLELGGSGAPRVRVLPRPRRTIVLEHPALAGSLAVSAVARSWERLPAPQTVTWFPPGGPPRLLVSPRPGAQVGLDTPLRLRFSTPVAALLRGRLPTLQRAVSGRWRTLDAHTLAFTPHGYGLGLATPVRVRLPVPVRLVGSAAGSTQTVAWQTRPASPLRLQQLLARLGYLPLRWTPATYDAAPTVRAQAAAAADPPRGTFTWRYPNTPPELRALWREGQPNQIVRGAVMMFQDTHGLQVDGFAGADVWRELIADTVAGKRRDSGYSYVYVHLTVPQSLNLWHDGKVILSSPGNTGVPAAPTQQGTFPVFEHIPVGTMSGTNPDGSHYDDPGIRYISYFNGGDAIHAFNRASFGTPQSLGCVELPLADAAKVWPYTPIGTLVTIEP
jgi:peptidoglycan hydrolase-like protein with peptidoglycan-binding domain